MKFDLKRHLAAVLALLTLCPAAAVSADEADPSYGLFEAGADNWAFSNSPDNFGDSYYLTPEDRETLYSNLKNTERVLVETALDDPFFGSCFGMATTSILASYNLIPYGDYRQYAYTTPSSLYGMTSSLYPTPNEAMQSLINYYFMLQFTDTIRQHDAWLYYNTSSTERLQYLISCVEDGSPTLLCYGNESMRHAVVAYGVEYGEYTIRDQKYDGRVLIYDNNYPLSFTDITSLYFNTTDWSWVIDAYGLTSERGGTIDSVIEDVSILNAGGKLPGTEYTPTDSFMQILGTNIFEGSFSLTTGTLTDDGWENGEVPENWKHAEMAFYTDNLPNILENHLLPGDEQGYCLTLDAPEYLETVLYSEDSMLYAYTDSGISTVHDPSGYIAIAAEPGNYHMEMTFNEGYYPTGWYRFTVEGYGSEESLRMLDDGYLLTADAFEEVIVTADNDDTDARISITTDAQEVFLYGTETGTLAAAIDTDSDGSYETVIAESTTYALGDVNADGAVDASDASEILIAAASAGAGEESTLDAQQQLAADANADGAYDANDASLVLQYAAEIGAGADLTFEEFLNP